MAPGTEIGRNRVFNSQLYYHYNSSTGVHIGIIICLLFSNDRCIGGFNQKEVCKMSTLGEFICKVFEKVTETELSGRSCFSLFGEVELPECLKEEEPSKEA